MPIENFENFIRDCRCKFHKELDEECGDFYNLIRAMLNECTSIIEEDILKENLQEEFKDYIKEF